MFNRHKTFATIIVIRNISLIGISSLHPFCFSRAIAVRVSSFIFYTESQNGSEFSSLTSLVSQPMVCQAMADKSMTLEFAEEF